MKQITNNSPFLSTDFKEADDTKIDLFLIFCCQILKRGLKGRSVRYNYIFIVIYKFNTQISFGV